jgi:hypothetical protein
VRKLWRAERDLALAISLMSVTLLLALSITATEFWPDELWGPRYLVPVAWLWILPIAWWWDTRRRRAVVGALAVVAVTIQFAGGFATYAISVPAAMDYSGEPALSFAPPADVGTATNPAVAYGNDGPTWIPGVSQLKFRLELVAAWVEEKLIGHGFVVHYSPVLGRHETIDLRHPAQSFGVILPNYWWRYPGTTTGLSALATLLAVMSFGATGALLGLATPTRRRDPPKGGAGGERTVRA